MIIIYFKAVCGSNSYDPTWTTCCDGELNSGGGKSCCGAQAYDTAWSTGCNGTVNSGGRKSCCGTQAYDTAWGTCCNGTVNSGEREILFSFFLSILSRSNFDQHLRCGGWLNFEFS